MKKVIIAIALFAITPLLVKAQLSKGQLFLGNTLSLSTSEIPSSYSGISSSTTSFGIGPLFGVFIGDKWALGVPIGYTYSRSTNEGGGTTFGHTSNTWSFGLLARRYFQLSEKFYLSIEGKASYSTVNSNYDSPAVFPVVDPITYGVYVRPMLVVFPSPVWSIEAGFSTLSLVNSQYKGATNCTNTFAFSAGTLNLGVSYFFKRK